MSSQPLRCVRFVVCAVLISLLSSLVPPVPSQAAPSGARAISRAATPALIAPPTDPAIPRPANAQSRGLPLSQLDHLRQRYGSRQQFLDLTDVNAQFEDTSFERYTVPGPWTLTPDPVPLSISEAYTTFTVPPALYQSVTVSASTTSTQKYGYAWLKIRPMRKTSWTTVPIISGVGPTTGTNVRVELGTTIGDEADSLEIQVGCTKGTFARDVQCTISDLHFFTDIPSWRITKGDVTEKTRIEVGATSSAGFTPYDGAFLTYMSSGSDELYTFHSPSFRLPTFSATDVLTMGVQWRRTVSAVDPTNGSPNNSSLALSVVQGTTSSVPIPLSSPTWNLPDWTPASSAQLSTDWSGRAVYLRLSLHNGNSIYALGLDAITFYLNGVPLNRVLPTDQQVGACPCKLGAFAQHLELDPVNTWSGSFNYDATDLAVASGGPPLVFTRQYASFFADPAQYPTTTLGSGWRHSFDHTLTFSDTVGGEPGKVMYESPSGNRLRFRDRGGDGPLEPVVGVRASLTRNGGQYLLTARDQSTLRFDAAGRLVEQGDPQGHAQTLSYYSGTGQPWDGQVQTVTDGPTGRTLTFSYTTVQGVTRLQQVQDQTGRAITYTYTADGDLETVQDVRGGTTTYQYTQEPHLLTAVVDPLGVTQVQNTYDGRQVVGQTHPSGEQVSYDYSKYFRVSFDAGLPADPYAANTTLPTGWNPQYHLFLPVISSADNLTTIMLTHPDGSREVLTDRYRNDGTLEYQTRNGQITQYVTFDGSFTPNTVVDGTGEAVTLTNTPSGQPTQITDATGKQTTLTYRADNRPQMMKTPENVVTTLGYDAAGNTTSVLQQGGNLKLTTIYTYTADNRLEAERSPDGVVTRYAYTAARQLDHVTVGDGTALAQTTTYTYDSLGRLQDTIVGAGTPLARTDRVTYNPDDTIASVIQNYQDGVFNPAAPDEDLITTAGYDLLGRPLWTRDPAGRYTATHYDDSTGRVDWTARNLAGYSGGTTLPATPPSYTPAAPDQNSATFFGYDGLGRTTLVTETGILTGTFDAATLQWSDATTRMTRTEYDALSRPVTTTLNYRPDQPASADTNVQTVTLYDGAGNVTWQRDALGRWTKDDYDAAQRPITTTVNFENGAGDSVDPANTDWTDGSDTDLVTAYRYDGVGRRERVIHTYDDGVYNKQEPDRDRITRYVYDPVSRVQQTITNDFSGSIVTNDLRRTVETRYDAANGRVQGQLNPLNIWTSYGYDALGRADRVVQNCTGSAPASCAAYTPSARGRNVITRTAFDALGRPETVTANYRDGVYSASTTDEDVTTRTLYDGMGRATVRIANRVPGAPAGPDVNVTIQTAYDQLGRVTSTIDPTGATTTPQYNDLDLPTQITDAAGRVTAQGYDGSGTLRWTKRADGQLTVFTTDGLGRVVATVQHYDDGVVAANEPDDQDLISRTIYDAGGRVRATVDPAEQVTTFGYDARDLLTTVTENVLDSGCTSARSDCNVTTSYQYDRAGNRTQITDARGNTRRFGYNAADERISETDGLNRVTSYQYDKGGRMLKRVDPRGAAFNVSWAYDDSTPKVTTSTTSTTTLSKPIIAQFDALGRRRSLQDGSATTATTFAVDALGRVTSVVAPCTGTACVAPTVGYGYTARGERAQLTYPNGTSVDYTYLPDGQLDLVTQGATTLADYGYDSAGRLHDVTRANGTTTTWTYDGADRLRDRLTTQGATTLSQFSSVVDRAGLRQQANETIAGTSRSITYDYDGLRRLTGAITTATTSTSTGATYDVAGNLTRQPDSGPTLVPGFNAANQRDEWSYDAAGNLLSDGTTTYRYDALGRVTLRATGGITTTNTYNGDGVLLRQQTGTTTTTYTQDLASPLDQILGDGTATYIYGMERLLAQQGSTRTWYDADALGSVRQTLSDSGTPTGSPIWYDPWGQVQSGTVPTFGFTGELQQGNDVYLRARWYNSASGTFTARDPFAGFPTQPYSLHPYQYGYSNPALWTDPSGRAVSDGSGDTSCPGGYVFWFVGYTTGGDEYRCVPATTNIPPLTWSERLDGAQNSLDWLGLAPVIGEPADALNAVIACLRGNWDDAMLSAVAVVPVYGAAGTGAKWAKRGIKYLRHVDAGAFRNLLRLGANDWTIIKTILDNLDSSLAIRTMTDRAGNSIGLLVGNREAGLKHIIGRHLTGDYSGAYTTFFSKQLKVGEVVDITAKTVQNGTRILDEPTGNWIYTWEHPTWGTIKVIVDSAGEVVSAFPTKTN